jgi:hypothetical protein
VLSETVVSLDFGLGNFAVASSIQLRLRARPAISFERVSLKKSLSVLKFSWAVESPRTFDGKLAHGVPEWDIFLGVGSLF